MRVKSLGQEGPLEEKKTTHSSSLAWEIPWTEEPGGLESYGRKCWNSHSDQTTATGMLIKCLTSAIRKLPQIPNLPVTKCLLLLLLSYFSCVRLCPTP